MPNCVVKQPQLRFGDRKKSHVGMHCTLDQAWHDLIVAEFGNVVAKLNGPAIVSERVAGCDNHTIGTGHEHWLCCLVGKIDGATPEIYSPRGLTELGVHV